MRGYGGIHGYDARASTSRNSTRSAYGSERRFGRLNTITRIGTSGRAFVGYIFAFGAFATCTHAYADDVAARIQAVEQGLRPSTALAGQAIPTRSILDAMRALHINGVSVAVIHDGHIDWAKGYGVAIAGGAPVTADTLFQAGSISKSVAAVAALQLVQRGRLSLDADVNDKLKEWHVPTNEFTKRHPVTLRGLLSHTAGVNVHGFDGYAAGLPVPTTLEVLDGRTPANSPAIRVVAEPGTAWSYSGGGYVIAQQLIADVTGKAFADWAHEHVLLPAGMSHSTFDQPLPSAWQDKAAMPYEAGGDAVKGGPHIYPEAAAAGLWTTPTDLARFILTLQSAISGRLNTLLDQKTANAMLQPVKPGHSMGFDLGGSGQDRYFEKGGDTEGFAGQIVAFADRGEGVAILTNSPNGNVLADELVRSIAAAYHWRGFETHVRDAIATDKTVVSRLLGTYAYGTKGRFTVHAEGEQVLIASPGDTPERFYAEKPNAWFTLSQDATFVFDDAKGNFVSGHIDVGGDSLPFHRVETAR